MTHVADGPIRWLSLDGGPHGALLERLEAVAALPYVDHVLALPDLHQKAAMEVPSSLAIATRDVLVPEFTSVAVNDGMGVIRTELRETDITTARLAELFGRVNRHAAAHPLQRNRYSFDHDTLRRVLGQGARGAVDRYGLDPATLRAFEDGGVAHFGDWHASRDEVVPWALDTPLVRNEIGLNFGGNHFLEVQVVDRVASSTAAAAWGLSAGQVVIMYHLGPGPFSGTLLHHYSRRSKLQTGRVPVFLLSKLVFHFLQRGGLRDAAGTWRRSFRRNGWTPWDSRSAEGLALRAAMAMAINYGHAYRLGTIAAVRDALEETFRADVGPTLLCDVPHNGIRLESAGVTESWVARHNACRLEPGAPTIVAGSSEVPSYLGLGGAGAGGRWHSYDHGIGELLASGRLGGAPRPGRGSVRFKMRRGPGGGPLSSTTSAAGSPEPIERLMELFERADVMHPAVRLRPLGTLKN